jgi:hypothetical protein
MLHRTRLANTPLAALCALGLLVVAAPAIAAPTADGKVETNCNDKIDNDGDSLTDCFDADCYGKPECKSSGGPENTNELCSDGVDNDNDGAIDCADLDCQRLGVTACKGSWKGPLAGTGVAPRKVVGKKGSDPDAIPKLGKGMGVEDLIGTGQDKDGERNDFVCSDGIDNDGDGAIDCQDFGCRFDPAVTVCSSHMAGIRFSVVARVNTTVDLEKDSGTRWDTRFTRLQLRAFGTIPGINNSFFLLSIRAENTVRLTFATFEVPIWRNHRLNINSGSGGLSATPVIGAQKRLLLDPAYYLYSAFEGGNGAALEFNGPIMQGFLDYRVMAFGGSGKFDGNVGGRFFKFDDANFTWAVGAQLGLHLFGRFDRFDSRFLYTQVPRSLSIYLGGRYDQRVAERFPAINLGVFFREWRILFAAEGYFKKELEFNSTQYSFNVQLGVLVIPKWLMVAADFGMFRAHDFELSGSLTAELRDELKRINDERMFRVAAHLFFYRNVGVLTVMFKDRFVENYSFSGADRQERALRFAAQYRF